MDGWDKPGHDAEIGSSEVRLRIRRLPDGEGPMEDLLELVVSATASGCIYALVALAYLLILRPTSVINFAVGEWAATGAFIGVAILTPLIWPRLEGPYWLALLAVPAILGVLGWLVEALTVRPLIRRGASITSSILALPA